MTRLFGSAVSNYIKRHPGKDGEISMGAAIKRMGGYKKIMKGIFSKLEGASYESELAALKEKYGEPKRIVEKAVGTHRAHHGSATVNHHPVSFRPSDETADI